ncbi:MAG: type II toxin-antitoxin system VapC family toxin [Bryobacteraceae bacterium]
MASELFADTAGWANYLVGSQPFHTQAKELLVRANASGKRVVTTNYVLAELVALLTSPLRVSRPLLITIIETIRSASWVEVVYIDSRLDQEAWTTLMARPDQTWSLVDCASFAVMRQRGIGDALTSDHHFEQAGFIKLLR